MVLGSFAFLLVLALWLVGARNRLMHHRQQLTQAFGPLALQLRKRHALARHAADAALRAQALPREAVEAVLASIAQAAAALHGAQGVATRPLALRRVAAAEEVLATALVPLLALRAAAATGPQAGFVTVPGGLEGSPATLPAAPPDGGGDPDDLQDMLLRLAQVHAPLDYARLAYNAAVQAHNAALRVFPTTLVAATFGFAAGVQMPRLSRPAGP